MDETTTKQAITNAKVIMVKTSFGGAVKVTKKEARRWLADCAKRNRDVPADITEIHDGKVLLVLG